MLHKSKRMSRHRCYVFTSFKTEEPEFESMDYMIRGLETCPSTQKKHWQGYVEFDNGVSFKTAQKRIGDTKAHFEPRRGSQKEAIEYCKKEGEWKEFGQKKAQGERTDLAVLRDEIIAGRSVDDITMDQPEMFHQYGRTLSKIEDIVLRSKFRTEMTSCEWVYGPTGVGKSHYAFKDYDPKTHYVWKDDNGWQDGYTGQEIVIINEFRGQIAYSELLSLIDKWPHFLKRRCREPVPFLAKKIIITSSLHPRDCYYNLSQRDSMDQLYRRCDIKNFTQKWSEGNTAK